MKQVKIISIFLFISIGNIFAQKQLREYIVIVRPVYHESTTEFLKKFSEKLSSEGYTYASNYLKAFSEGKGFGSGFLVKGDDGKTYILTNRHVVMQAETANIEFSNTDGSKVNYEGCKIIEIDNDNDLALLAFPEDATVQKALNFSVLIPFDGQEVFSAGFPGMAGKPSWQLGKGIVSNAAFSMETLDEDLKMKAIQHTAQIDRGSSGSPLLIADTTQVTGYSALGLNTWKVLDRENVNLTIPVSTIQQFITRALSSERIDNNQILEKMSQQFASDAQHGYKKILKYVSYNYISKISVEEFFQLWKKSSKDAMEDISDVFEHGHPIEAVRIAIADNIYRSIEKNKNSFSYNSITGLASNDTPTTVMMSLNNKQVNSVWLIEQNQWKLKDISTLKVSETEQFFGIARDFKYTMNVSTELYFPSDKVEKVGYGAEVSFGYKSMFGFALHKYSHMGYNKDPGTYEVTDEGYVDYKEGLLFLGYQYPFHIKKIFLLPYIKFGVGLNFGDISSLTSATWYGLQAAYKLKNNDYIMAYFKIAPRYIDTNFAFDMYDSPYEYLSNPTKFNGFSLGIGYAF